MIRLSRLSGLVCREVVGLLLVGMTTTMGCAATDAVAAMNATPRNTPTLTQIAVTQTTMTATPTPGVFYRPLLRETTEWSANFGGISFGPPRGTGFVVQLVDCEGPRVKIIDPNTHGPAYIDRDAVEVPSGFCSQIPGQGGPKTVVVAVAGPAVYSHTSVVLGDVSRLMRAAAEPGDTFIVMWLNGADVIPPVHVPVQSVVPHSPSPTVTPCGPYDKPCRVMATATATTLLDQGELDSVPGDARQDVTKAANELETLSLAGAPSTSDVLPALARAQLLLDGVPGPHYLFIAGPLQPPATEELAQLRLSGTFIRFLGPDCPDPVRCAQWDHVWRDWAATANADVAVYDESVDLVEKVQ